jgi:amino acid transporter
MGFVVYVVMVALGEMGAWLPHKKSFSGYASRFVDPAMGFATGWNYFFKYVIVLPNNLTATGIILQYWLPNINVSVWIVVFGVVIILLNVRLSPPTLGATATNPQPYSSSTSASLAKPSSGCPSSRPS